MLSSLGSQFAQISRAEIMKLFLVLCFVPLISARSLKGRRETDTCITDYLKSAGLIQEESLGTDQPLNPLCSAIVEVTKNNILESVRSEVLSDKEMQKEADCIMNSLKKSDFGNSLLLLYIYETSEGIDETVKAEKMHQAQLKVVRATFDSFMVCQATKKFGEMFDSIMEDESSSEEETDPKEDYCMRKHIVDHKLISIDHHNLNVNPKHLDVATLDCTVLYQKALKDAEDELVKALLEDSSSEEVDDAEKTNTSPADVQCLLEVVREGNFIDQMLQFDYIKEFNLDQVKQKEMRSKFINIMTRLADSASKCFLK